MEIDLSSLHGASINDGSTALLLVIHFSGDGSRQGLEGPVIYRCHSSIWPSKCPSDAFSGHSAGMDGKGILTDPLHWWYYEKIGSTGQYFRKIIKLLEESLTPWVGGQRDVGVTWLGKTLIQPCSETSKDFGTNWRGTQGWEGRNHLRSQWKYWMGQE